MNNNFKYNPLENSFSVYEPYEPPKFESPLFSNSLDLPWASTITDDGIIYVAPKEEEKLKVEITNNPEIKDVPDTPEVPDEQSKLEVSTSRTNTAAYIKNSLEEYGITNPIITSAILGTIMVESGFNTKALNAKEGAYGLCQWRLDRRLALKAFAKKNGTTPDNIDTQIAFMLSELNGTYKKAGQALQNAKSVEEATSILLHLYERAAPSSLSLRIAYAKHFYNMFK